MVRCFCVCSMHRTCFAWAKTTDIPDRYLYVRIVNYFVHYHHHHRPSWLLPLLFSLWYQGKKNQLPIWAIGASSILPSEGWKHTRSTQKPNEKNNDILADWSMISFFTRSAVEIYVSIVNSYSEGKSDSHTAQTIVNLYTIIIINYYEIDICTKWNMKCAKCEIKK